MNLSNAALIKDCLARMKNGDPDAFGDLYTSVHGDLVLYIAKIMKAKDFTDAEDLASETMCKVRTSIERFDESFSDERCRNWLITIARNTVLNHLARLKVRRKFHYKDHTPEDYFASRIYENRASAGNRKSVEAVPDPRPLVSQTMDEDMLRDIMHRATHSLPIASRREAFIRHANGESTVEIAEAMSVSEVNVRVMCHRARKNLQKNPELKRFYEETRGASLQNHAAPAETVARLAI